MKRPLTGIFLAGAIAIAAIAGSGTAAAALVDLAPPTTKGTAYSGPPRLIGIAQANAPATPLDLFTGFVNSGSQPTLEVGLTSTPGGWAPVTIGNSTQDIAVQGRPNDLELADVNADGNVDAALAHEGGVSLSRGAASGVYGAMELIGASGGTATSGVALADIGPSARPDLIATTSAAFVVYMNTNLSNPPYSSATSYATDAGTTDVVAADFDGDGHQDLATAASSTQRATVLPYNTDVPPFFVLSARSLGLFTRPGALAAGNVSGDSRPELIVTEPDRGTVAIVSTGGMPNSLGPAQRVTTGFGPVDVVVADLDRDGRQEIVTANAGSDAVTVTEVGGETRSYPAGPTPSSLAVAEVTGDSRPDVVVANDSTRGISILANLGVPAAPAPPAAPGSSSANTATPISAPAPGGPVAPSKRSAKLSCTPKGKPGAVLGVVCTATLSDPAAAKSLTATLSRKGSKHTLASATAKPGKKLRLLPKASLAAGSYVVALTVVNADATKLTDERVVKVTPQP